MTDVYDYHERERATREQAAASRVEMIRDYRERHPEATGSDKAIAALAEMEALAGRRPLW